MNPPNNLPIQLSSFIGRQREITEVKRLLSIARLVTLTGAGGSGKTRLALHVARELIDSFNDGVWWVELAALSDPELVPQIVMKALGMLEQSSHMPTDTLLDYLREKDLLLVLDNCEHLIDACAQQIILLMQHCPNVHILATSRAALNLDGEYIWIVPSLELPNRSSHLSTSKLQQYDAIKLFMERASAISATLKLTDQNAAAITQICQRLDGIPLAIELAAARVKVLSVEGIAARLEDALRLLTEGKRSAPQRHQTLRATLDWSYDLLPILEQIVFCRLSVFAGGFTLEAAEAICNGDNVQADDVMNLLMHLVDKSLLVKPEQDKESRYRMLEPLRQYAYAKLLDVDNVEILRKQHLTYFLAFAEKASTELTGRNQLEWFQRLELERDNLRAALGWALERGAGDAAIRLCLALALFWGMYGYVGEGRQWLQRTLNADYVQHIQSAPTTERLRYGYVLNWASDLASRQGDYQAARAFAERGLILLRELDDKQGIAFALYNLGLLAHNQGNYKAARKLDEEALALWRALGNNWGIAHALEDLGLIALAQHDNATARKLFEENLALWRELDVQGGIAFSFNELGLVSLAQGDYEGAKKYLEESLTLHHGLGNKWGIVHNLTAWASLAFAQKFMQRAAKLSGAVAGLLLASGASLDEPEGTMHSTTVSALRTQLDETTFAKEWTEGHTLTLEQAMAEVEQLSKVSQPKIHNPNALTPRELDVLRLLVEGLSDAQIAESLIISRRTVNTHLTSIYNKLSVNSRSAATRHALDHKLI